MDRAMEWLEKHEPQCARVVAQHLDEVEDFLALKHYAHGCARVFSRDRWVLTGEAGVFTDPFYSPGSDFIAMGNECITDLIVRERRGEDIGHRAEAFNTNYLRLYDGFIRVYDGQYPLMGNAQVMTSKVIWDTAFYWAIPGLLFFHDKIRRLNDSPYAFSEMYRAWSVHATVQAFLREWHSVENVPASDAFADPYSRLLLDLHKGMAAGLPDDELEEKLASNRRLMEQLAGQLVSTVIDRLRSIEGDPAISSQVERWMAEAELQGLIDTFRKRDPDNPIDQSGVTLGSSQFQHLEVLT
jgi:hypothetical protein